MRSASCDVEARYRVGCRAASGDELLEILDLLLAVRGRAEWKIDTTATLTRSFSARLATGKDYEVSGVQATVNQPMPVARQTLRFNPYISNNAKTKIGIR
jgi:hypothetical protein